ncbi:hypothetical protein CO172_00125 [Candidatus Uhrbacteria bacterium CG_4_9_14_3_um_filter_36_7]|uniref:Antitoxin n=1 Tax=Candidatus Uhrbacteria bacterium CG_4_9_14_3_um_filter_36_7 TaxID=1975033 RepID=A0A2M7XIJ9_9BACT|nr:MAG: hypothetical protein CO172_00125 [Candidatus Uhrbacteria bacterium CG_4_9_14_3_um_filter_36_7]
MNNLVNLKELRENVTKYANRVAKGDSFIVMKRSKPLFKISPIDEDGWETIIDFTKFRKGGMPVDEVIKALKAID